MEELRSNEQDSQSLLEQAMKLGEMQRWSYDPIVGAWLATHDGMYVHYFDAQAKSIADERRIKMLEEALEHLSVNWWVRHYGKSSGDAGLTSAIAKADELLSGKQERNEHPCKRGEKSVKGLPILEALKEHCSASVGEDAYIRIYPVDAREIVAALRVETQERK